VAINRIGSNHLFNNTGLSYQYRQNYEKHKIMQIAGSYTSIKSGELQTQSSEETHQQASQGQLNTQRTLQQQTSNCHPADRQNLTHNCAYHFQSSS
jgi:hypothetical protein